MTQRTAIYSDLDMELTKATNGDVTRMVEEDAIINSLQNILSTMQGSRRMLSDFAASIYNLIFEPVDEITARQIGEEAIGAIEKWDSRIIVDVLNIKPSPDKNMYECDLNFRIVSSNTISRTYNFILKG